MPLIRCRISLRSVSAVSRTATNLPEPHDGDPRRQLEDVIEVVADDQLRQTTLGEPLDKFDHPALFLQAECRHRFVHHQDRRALVDGAGDGDALALTSRQRARLAVDVRDPHFEIGECVDRAAPHLRAAQQPERPELRDQLASEVEVLDDVAVIGECEVLVDGCDAGVAGRRRRGEPNLVAGDHRCPASGRTAPHSILIIVDLPAPLSPTMAVTLPAGNSIDTSLTAATPP